MINIELNGKHHQLPQEWTEVEKGKLPELLGLIYFYREGGETYLEIVRVLLGYKPKQWKKLIRTHFGDKCSEQQLDGNSEVIAKLLNLVSWMWTSDLTAMPMEGFQVNDQQWVLFEEGFKSMSFGELSDAHVHAQAFIKQLIPGEQRLDLLVATLCRPQRSGDYQNDPCWNGDRREAYNEHIARHRSELIAGGFVKEKILVLMYFLGTLKDTFSYYDLFSSDGSGPAPTEDYPGQSMLKNQHLLAEKHIFGGMAQTKSANVHEVFQFLEEHSKDIKAHNERVNVANNESNG